MSFTDTRTSAAALDSKYIPSITTQKNVTWKSNKKTIATVSRRGVVLGKAIGKFTISASAYGLSTKVGGSIATCRNIDWTRKRNVVRRKSKNELV
jgi:hypothetical protein